jgi:hypothetical protein
MAQVKPQVIDDEEHERVYERVAAVDVAKDTGMVCTRVPHRSRPGARQSTVWTVKARMTVIGALGRQLRADGIEMVTLESTSDYWRIWFFVLEAAGLAVQLVNAAQARNLPGRPKTDLLTELLDVSAAQVGRPSLQSIAEMSGRSGSPGCCSPVASLITTETGHTELNQSAAFSSLPIFDVSRSGPRALLQCL